MSPGIAVAPSASITTSQAETAAADAVPTLAIFPPSMTIASPAATGDCQSPVTSVPMLTIATFIVPPSIRAHQARQPHRDHRRRAASHLVESALQRVRNVGRVGNILAIGARGLGFLREIH